jgi:hypothetical protein
MFESHWTVLSNHFWNKVKLVINCSTYARTRIAWRLLVSRRQQPTRHRKVIPRNYVRLRRRSDVWCNRSLILMRLKYLGKQSPKTKFLSRDRKRTEWLWLQGCKRPIIPSYMWQCFGMKPMLLHHPLNLLALQRKNKNRMSMFSRANKEAREIAADFWIRSITISSMK